MKRFLVKAFMRLFSWLPLGVHYFNAHILGWLARCVVRYRVKVVKENIDKAFPEKTPKERRRIIKDFYLHFGQIITETVWFSGCSPRRIQRSGIARITNPEFLDELQAKADGTIVLSAHCATYTRKMSFRSSSLSVSFVPGLIARPVSHSFHDWNGWV